MVQQLLLGMPNASATPPTRAPLAKSRCLGNYYCPSAQHSHTVITFGSATTGIMSSFSVNIVVGRFVSKFCFISDVKSENMVLSTCGGVLQGGRGIL